MLARLSIRDIVLIDRLDIDFVSGLSVLTGETGAGKSILLDAFALALGARGDVALVRQGVAQGQVTAAFELPAGHPVRAFMAANDIPAEDELILRRVQLADGRTRAFVNDQPVSAQTLKALGAALVEIHGQHDERALVDMATHRRLLDAFGGLEAEAAEVGRLWEARRSREGEVAALRAEVERAQREADFLRHAVEELARLAPEPSEETALAEKRTVMMQAEKVAADLHDVHEAVAGAQSPVPALSAALRRLERRAAHAPALTDRAHPAQSREGAIHRLLVEPPRGGEPTGEPRLVLHFVDHGEAGDRVVLRDQEPDGVGADVEGGEALTAGSRGRGRGQGVGQDVRGRVAHSGTVCREVTARSSPRSSA